MIAELLVLFGVMLLALGLQIPVFLAMTAGSAAYALVFWGKVPAPVIGQSFVQGLDSYSFAAILFFFLAGELMNAGGITERLMRLARALVGHVRGGLSHVSILASMVFAGVSGSAVADAAAVGSVMIPAMKRDGYGAPYAAAVIAAAATIGPVIPPSIPFVVYGLFALVSVGKLFLAGVIPGLLMGLFLLVASYVIARRRNYPATAWAGWRELGAATMDSALALLMPIIVVVGLVGGIATVNEVGAVAAVYAMLVGTLVYRRLGWAELWHACCRAGIDSCKVLIIIAASGIFIWIVGNMGVGRVLAAWVSSLTGDPLLVLGAFAIVLLIAGLILEPVTILVVLVPLMIPTAKAVGIDLVHLGVVSVLATLIGLITPPVGFLIYLEAAQAEAPVHHVVRELLPFIAALVLLLVALVIFPPLSLFLPRMIMG